MNGYWQSMPVVIRDTDELWDAYDLIKNHYAIYNDNWEYCKNKNAIVLKKETPMNHDLDPWNRLITAWRYENNKKEVIETGGWSSKLSIKFEGIIFDVRYTSVEKKGVCLFKYN